MARKWTDEERAAASERYRQRMVGATASAPASVAPAATLPRLRPDGGSIDPVGHISREMQFLAQVQDAEQIETTDDVYAIEGNVKESPEDSGTVRHKTSGLVYMYRHEPYGWRRVRVTLASVAELLRSGYLPYCGDCGGTHDEGINSCPKREPRLYRTCPVPTCRKKVYDIEEARPNFDEVDDPSAIKDDSYSLATPELRTKARLDAHIRAYHESQAVSLGLFGPAAMPVPGAPRPVGVA